MKKTINNKIIYLALICILLSSSFYLYKKISNKSDCVTFLENKGKSFDTSKKVDDYTYEVATQVFKKRYIIKPYGNCSRAEEIKYYLNKHSLISQARINQTGSAIIYFRKDFVNGWVNLLMHR